MARDSDWTDSRRNSVTDKAKLNVVFCPGHLCIECRTFPQPDNVAPHPGHFPPAVSGCSGPVDRVAALFYSSVDFTDRTDVCIDASNFQPMNGIKQHLGESIIRRDICFNMSGVSFC